MAKDRAVVTFKIGGDKVRYEASREAVEAQLEKVLNRLLERGATMGHVSVAIDGPSAVEESAAAPTSAAVPAPSSEAKPPLSEAKLIEKLYDTNTDGQLVMSRVPQAPADVLLLVLYGISKVVQDSPWVSAPLLVKTAREAGAQFERGDRLLGKRPKLIQAQGRGRGKAYRLTPQGEEYCQRLARGLIEGPRG